MKKKNMPNKNSKLSINKITITSLDSKALQGVRGGEMGPTNVWLMGCTVR